MFHSKYITKSMSHITWQITLLSLLNFFKLLLIMSGIEQNPGPGFLKSLFSFKVTSGLDGKLELHGLYKNQSSCQLEELSPCSQQTPKDKKYPLGPIQRVSKVNEKIIKLLNNVGQEVDLLWTSLSPQIIPGESNLKEILMKSKEENSMDAFVSVINSCIAKLNSSSACVTNTNESRSSSSEPSHGDESSDDVSISDSQNNDSPGNNSTNKDDTMEDQSRMSEDEITDIEEKIRDIISSARFAKVKLDRLEIPNDVVVDKKRVASLRDAMKFVDHTQAWIGCLKVVDDDEMSVKPFQVYVNPELLVLHRELDSMREDRNEVTEVPCVIHTVYESYGDAELIGQFLQNNSKTFASKIRNTVVIQDMLAFVISSKKTDESNSNEKFLKNSLRYFSKGTTKNIKVLLEFGKLPQGNHTLFFLSLISNLSFYLIGRIVTPII